MFYYNFFVLAPLISCKFSAVSNAASWFQIKKLKSQLLCNETQYKHDLRKKDRQLSVLKEKTQQILMEKTKVGHSSSLDMSKCLQRVDGKRSKWRNESTSNRYVI